jgi:glycosyltransferase involved in cell wall biosynthesis
MRVLFVINQLESGGAEQQLVALCEGLIGRGHETTVVSIYDRLDLRHRLDAVGVPISVVGKSWKGDVSVVWRLRRLIRAAGPDIIHAYLPAACLLTGLTKWLGVRAPVIQSERNINDWRSWSRIRLENLVRRRVAAVVCNAEAVRQYLVHGEGVPVVKTTVIYNGLVLARRTRPGPAAVEAAGRDIGAPPGARIAVCVANFLPDKRHDVLLEAVRRARLAEPSLFLVLVGQGAGEAEVRHAIARLGLTEACVVFTDRLDPLPLLSAAHMAVLASAREGLPNALMEAMAMGLPIVASNAGGNRELVVHERGGFVCRPGDVSAFAAALVRLARDPGLAEAMGRFNRARIASFTDDRMVEETLRLYDRVLQEAGAA